MIWRFLISKRCLCGYLLMSVTSICYVWYRGQMGVKNDFSLLATWLRGGDYQGNAVLSVAFAMNTWGLAVKSTRHKVRSTCRKSISALLRKLRTGSYLSVLDTRVQQGALSGWEAFWLRILEANISRYDEMMSKMLDISSALTRFLMGVAAIASVTCMILGVNGRFAAFLLLPYPLFWCYSRCVIFWVKFLLGVPMFLLNLSGRSVVASFDSTSFNMTLASLEKKLPNGLESRG